VLAHGWGCIPFYFLFFILAPAQNHPHPYGRTSEILCWIELTLAANAGVYRPGLFFVGDGRLAASSAACLLFILQTGRPQ
jgi:hypothetical protein